MKANGRRMSVRGMDDKHILMVASMKESGTRMKKMVLVYLSSRMGKQSNNFIRWGNSLKVMMETKTLPD